MYLCGLKHQSTISTHFKQSLEEKVTRFKANQEKVEECQECSLTVLPQFIITNTLIFPQPVIVITCQEYIFSPTN